MALSFVRIACVLGMLGVAAGAFGAHGLRAHVSAERLQTYETGVRYLMVHVPALLVVGLLARRSPIGALWWSGIAFLAGILVFTGSLLLMVLLDRPALGAVTPVGGVALMVGWALLGVGAGGALRRGGD